MPAPAHRVVLATTNAGKVAEVGPILASCGLNLELVGLRDVAPYPEPVEDGATFAANALLKARAAFAATGMPALADDSGLVVDALNGMPGILSARWSGRDANDERNLQLVLDQIADVPDPRRTGAFVCAAAYVAPDGTEVIAEGRWPGTLVRAPRGENGFGYDPIFVPDGETRTSAELAPTEKNAMSHRSRAFRALAERIARRPS